ncbi:RICIN domain-containing protein [Streptomyces sp. NPDC050848]|uniref:RICIN domain-containing protein n=1 Tax=Streptomyces sp. NPDC050848 TaxID=3155791 RepID=UPI0033F51BE7
MFHLGPRAKSARRNGRRRAERRTPVEAGVVAAVVLAGSVIAGGTATGVAPTIAPQSPSQCREGYKWRQITPSDYVCIPWQEFYFLDIDRLNAIENTNSAGQCLNGYRHRYAVPGDKLCVNNAAYNRTRRQNAHVAYGWAGTASRDPETRTVLHPFNWDGPGAYTITSGGTDPRRPLVVDVFAASTADEIKLGVWGRHFGDNQKFHFQAPRTGDGNVYRNRFDIVAKHSGKCLDVEWGSTKNGTRVQQFRCTGNINQKWYLWRRGDNKWEIRSAHSEKCLDIHSPSGTPQPGAHLQIWPCHGGSNQAWTIRHAK